MNTLKILIGAACLVTFSVNAQLLPYPAEADSIQNAINRCDIAAAKLTEEAGFIKKLRPENNYYLTVNVISNFLRQSGNDEECIVVMDWWLSRGAVDIQKIYYGHNNQMIETPLEVFASNIGFTSIIPNNSLLNRGKWLNEKLKKMGYDLSKNQYITSYSDAPLKKERLPTSTLAIEFIKKRYDINFIADTSNLDFKSKLLKFAILDTDPMTKDSWGNTALTLAASKGNANYSSKDLIEILLMAGADKNYMDNSKRKAFDYAVLRGDTKAALLLK